MKRLLTLTIILLSVLHLAGAAQRQKLNFNSGWLLAVGDTPSAAIPGFDDTQWKKVTLPYAFNGDEAFRKDIVEHTDTVVWYRKHFRLDITSENLVFIEFEGARQGADVFVNGRHVGLHENGIMAFGFDITPFVKNGKNVIAVRCDNNWRYRSKEYNSPYQWNDRNFNANYGGLPKNVFLHITGRLHQTLPLYSSLKTTGTYIYASDIDVKGRRAVINVESEVCNSTSTDRTFSLLTRIYDIEGRKIAEFCGKKISIKAGQTAKATARRQVKGLHFWSWGYGYLYTVKTSIKEDGGADSDIVTTRTGFRKTLFENGKIWLNDRIIMMHGYAQRTSNEWPGVGLSVPAWLSDYSNRLMTESGGNLVRWMHVTPWKQDIESCDRMGLIEAMPAVDAEKDVTGPRWEQRVAVMRDAIIYNRNNPSILFYEGGNKGISREHMLELKAIRDEYDPHGGRAIGSREMLDIDEAEYGGEMLYVNKSGKHPMWSMEYCRDEGLRKYWDEYSYPFHKEGDGPLYRGKPATDYNHNMDMFAIEMVKRWREYWQERPGTGRRVSSGGVKIVFSDTNTHHRGESNYRTSGVTDAMRIPKDAFFAHQVMWDGWVTPEKARTHIIGHWNYDAGTVKPVYVVSNADSVELFVNGRSMGCRQRNEQFLFTFNDIPFERGTIVAVASNGSSDTLRTAGDPCAIRLTSIGNVSSMKADGADMALIEVEVIDKDGLRCPLDNRMIHFTISGEGEWIGGIAAHTDTTDIRDRENYVGSHDLPVECGVNRVLVRSTPKAGTISLTATADGIAQARIAIKTDSVDAEHYLPQLTLPCNLSRGETPSKPSCRDIYTTVDIKSAEAGCNSEAAGRSFDDNETTEWKSDGKRENAWITYRLACKTTVDHITLKLTGWRSLFYPLAIYSGDTKVWEGVTQPTLGYVHIDIAKPVPSDRITVRMTGPSSTKSETGDTAELAGGKATELDRVTSRKGAVNLRIVEVDMLHCEK